MVTELALQFFKLHQQTRQLLVAALGILGQRQGVGDALAEQLELGAELRHGFRRAKPLAALLGSRLGLVELGVHLGNGVDDAGPLGGIVDLQRSHQPGEHVQVGGHLAQPCQGFGQLRHGLGFLRLGIECLQVVVIRL